MITLNEYQVEARQFAIYPEEASVVYPALGLSGEAGEVAEKVKKSIRGDKPLDIEEVAKELGDVLWYVANLASDIGVSLNTLAEKNLEKLYSRKERQVIKGSGDNR
jgi:NTP pyrophosphatase (non-canonical NTP hydrolase)